MFENDALTRVHNNLEWDWSPVCSWKCYKNNHQETSIKILQNPSGPVMEFHIKLSLQLRGVSNTYSDTTEPGLETIDQLGLRIATLINANAGIDAIYNDSTNEIVLEAIQKNTAFSLG